VVCLAQGAGDAGQEVDGAYVGPLVEALADLQPQAPEADVVGNGGPADSAEVDGVEVLQALQPVVGHHLAGALVVVAAPGELLPGEAESTVGVVGQGLQDGASC